MTRPEGDPVKLTEDQLAAVPLNQQVILRWSRRECGTGKHACGVWELVYGDEGNREDGPLILSGHRLSYLGMRQFASQYARSEGLVLVRRRINGDFDDAFDFRAITVQPAVPVPGRLTIAAPAPLGSLPDYLKEDSGQVRPHSRYASR